MKRILIIGGTGMLGHKLVQKLRTNAEVWSTIRQGFSDVSHFGIFDEKRTITRLNVIDFDQVAKAIRQIKPDVIINAVGVIKQLPSANDVVRTLTLNSLFPQRLAMLRADLDFRLITISTDCVFDGQEGNYSEDDIPNANDLYGQSKRWGEVSSEGCLTIRTSIIGRELATRHSLFEWFLANKGGNVKGFSKAIYSGFPTIVFADIIRDLIFEQPDLYGLFHVSSEPINKFELLGLVRSAYDVEIEIEKFADFAIDRSLDSSRFRRLTGFAPRSWPEMVEMMANDPTEYDKWRM